MSSSGSQTAAADGDGPAPSSSTTTAPPSPPRRPTRKRRATADTDADADDAGLESRVHSLEHELRAVRQANQRLRRENRVLASALATREPSVYSAPAVLEWVDADIMHAVRSQPLAIPPPPMSLPTGPLPPLAVAAAAVVPMEIDELAPPPGRAAVTVPPPPLDDTATAAGRRRSARAGRTTSSPPRKQQRAVAPADASADPPVAAPLLPPPHPPGAPSTAPAAAPPISARKAALSRDRRRAVLPVDVPLDAETTLPAAAAFPIDLGTFTLLALGEVSVDDGFANERYIYPVGFSTQRTYQSAVNRDGTTTYTSTISASPAPRGLPIFSVTAADQPSHVYTGINPSQCWTAVLRATSAIRDRTHAGNANGHEYFGLNHPFVTAWIQRMPRADRVPKYAPVTVEITRAPNGSVEVMVGEKKTLKPGPHARAKAAAMAAAAMASAASVMGYRHPCPRRTGT
ncbi:hypothetical protein H9P43_008559 [Blastocladiella emersonii ATCC 22665]|nr:hypothetical protein H9P43_008559 [Blastocladiella emersonii ATCC 22665]